MRHWDQDRAWVRVEDYSYIRVGHLIDSVRNRPGRHSLFNIEKSHDLHRPLAITANSVAFAPITHGCGGENYAEWTIVGFSFF